MKTAAPICRAQSLLIQTIACSKNCLWSNWFRSRSNRRVSQISRIRIRQAPSRTFGRSSVRTRIVTPEGVLTDFNNLLHYLMTPRYTALIVSMLYDSFESYRLKNPPNKAVGGLHVSEVVSNKVSEDWSELEISDNSLFLLRQDRNIAAED